MAYYDLSVAAEHTGRKLFTYESPEKLQIGTIVNVPFARKSAPAIVRASVKKPTFNTRKITSLSPYILSSKSLEFIKWLEEYYSYDWGEINKLFIPHNLSVKSRLKDVSVNQTKTIDMPILNKEQSAAVDVIIAHKSVILHGATGSGKTRVFLETAKKTLNSGKNVLICTPEIGLTPQLVEVAKQYFDYDVLETHSQKTPAQRKQIWERVYNNQNPAIVIGPRSSLFLPYSNLGLVVADESHDQSYKNMSSPRYYGLHLAAKLASVHGARFIQSTATPNLSEYDTYLNKGLPVIRMQRAAAGERISNGYIVDLNDKNNFSQSKYLSDDLVMAAKQALVQKQQVMLFFNRRGSARIVRCNKCGHTEECPNCGLPLTYHHDNYSLVCHICGHKTTPSSNCPVCESSDLLYLSLGTKGLESELHKIFPSTKIARFDLDNAKKENLKSRYQELKSGEIGIILGTQLISKGLDLPKLSVVGVLDADSSLQFPDYKAEENAFQQIYQVTGRVGRGHLKGKYFIQTRSPENPVIKAALHRNYQAFYDYESSKRKRFLYPPYCHMALLKISKTNERLAENKAQKLKANLSGNKQLSILGPSPSYQYKINNKYYWQLVIKAKARKTILESIKNIDGDWQVDVDPINLL